MRGTRDRGPGGIFVSFSFLLFYFFVLVWGCGKKEGSLGLLVSDQREGNCAGGVWDSMIQKRNHYIHTKISNFKSHISKIYNNNYLYYKYI